MGRYAARAARGFGATVMVMDNDINKLSKLQDHVGEQLFTNILDTQLIAKITREHRCCNRRPSF